MSQRDVLHSFIADVYQHNVHADELIDATGCNECGYMIDALTDALMRRFCCWELHCDDWPDCRHHWPSDTSLNVHLEKP